MINPDDIKAGYTLGHADAELLRELVRRVLTAESALNNLAEILHGGVTDVALLPVTARSLLARANSSAIPNGWKLVPVEPTEAMIEAGDMHMDGVSNLGLAWDAMLVASPLPPAPGGDD